MRTALHLVLVASAFLVTATPSADAFAQAGPGDNTGGGGGGGAAAGAAPAPIVQQASPTQLAPNYGGFVAPQTDPSAPLGGGNATESSARGVSGDREDSFDLGPKSGAGGTAFGGSNGPIFLDNGLRSQTLGGASASQVHVVRKGDTLWDICDANFRNPYQWPRVWSFNPEIQNPHWIYPGQQIRLRPGAQISESAPQNAVGPSGLISRARTFGPETVFLREDGFIEHGDDDSLDWGELLGSREDKLFLSDYDETYVHISGKHEPKIGQELTVFRKVREAASGNVIQIQGTLKINDWNPKDRVARAVVTESLDPIERGARIGPVNRKFEVVSPVRNENEAQGHIISSVHPHDFWGQNQVIFIDVGAKAGLVAGNRMFIVRRGDAYHQSLPTGGAAMRIAIEDPSPAAIDRVPRFSDSKYPEEVIGEIRLLDVRNNSSTALVSSTRREIEINDVVVARKGY